MKHIPASYEFETGDVVGAKYYYQVAIRIGKDDWRNSVNGNDGESYTDEMVQEWLERDSWMYMGNTKARES